MKMKKGPGSSRKHSKPLTLPRPTPTPFRFEDEAQDLNGTHLFFCRTQDLCNVIKIFDNDYPIHVYTRRSGSKYFSLNDVTFCIYRHIVICFSFGVKVVSFSLRHIVIFIKLTTCWKLLLAIRKHKESGQD